MRTFPCVFTPSLSQHGEARNVTVSAPADDNLRGSRGLHLECLTRFSGFHEDVPSWELVHYDFAAEFYTLVILEVSENNCNRIS